MPVVPTGDIRRTAARAAGARGLNLTRSDGQVGTDGAISLADPWLCRPGYLDLIDGAGAGHPEGQGDLTGSERDTYRIEFDAATRTIAGEQDLDFPARLTRFAKRRRSQPSGSRTSSPQSFDRDD